MKNRPTSAIDRGSPRRASRDSYSPLSQTQTIINASPHHYGANNLHVRSRAREERALSDDLNGCHEQCQEIQAEEERSYSPTWLYSANAQIKNEEARTTFHLGLMVSASLPRKLRGKEFESAMPMSTY